MKNQLCVFCGEKPSEKNKEHILPQWLLSMTGKPNRVVNFGIDYERGEIIKFSWAGLVVPACTSCNPRYGEQLAGAAKKIIETLLQRRPRSEHGHARLLNWLDQVG